MGSCCCSPAEESKAQAKPIAQSSPAGSKAVTGAGAKLSKASTGGDDKSQKSKKQAAMKKSRVVAKKMATSRVSGQGKMASLKLKPKLTTKESASTQCLIDGSAAVSSSLSAASSASNASSSSRCPKVNFNGRTNAADGSEEHMKRVLATGRLGRDQKLLVMAVGGGAINQETTGTLMTRADVERMRRKKLRSDMALLVREPFSTLHAIAEGIYLSGCFGLQRDVMEAANISLVINATWELQLLKVGGLITYRVPVEDDATHQIDVYFDDVADAIESTRRRGFASVVHCAAGVSRSSTLVLAYLLKYTELTLRAAFAHTRAIRPCIRPNMGFMAQLIGYERRLRGTASVQMITVRDRTHHVSLTVPDFYPEHCRDLYDWELGKAKSELAAKLTAK